MLKKKIIPVFLASVLVISGTAGFSAGIVSENVYASEEVHICHERTDRKDDW